MNYLELILQFWKLRRSKRITSLQADLYFYLIQECNERNWENPFECSNKLICGSISISEPSLIDARNRLQQLGIIEFKSGKRNETSPVYRLFNLKNLSRNRTVPLVESLDETEMKGEPIKNKLNKTKPKQNISSAADAPAKEKKELPYWKTFVDVFDSWYLQHLKQKYFYQAKDFAALKKIYKFFENRAAEKKFEFTEENLLSAFKFFLNKAWDKDNWLKNNFSITNLLSQFNQIVNENARNNSDKQSTGGSVSTASAFNKIDRMFGKN